MTMFDVDTVNVEKKLQEIEDNDLYNFMKKQGYSEEQIKSAIKNTHLLDANKSSEKKFYVSRKKLSLFCKRMVGKKKR